MTACIVHAVAIDTTWSLLSSAVLQRSVSVIQPTATSEYVAMDNVLANSEKEFAVIKFHADDTYSTCSQRNKAADSAGFFVGEEVTIRWSKYELYKGIVVFTNGKQFY